MSDLTKLKTDASNSMNVQTFMLGMLENYKDDKNLVEAIVACIKPLLTLNTLLVNMTLDNQIKENENELLQPTENG